MTSEKNSSFNENMPSNDSFEVLENEFDKAFVDLDVLIGEYEQDNPELTFECRRRLTLISGIFVQFVHKVQIMNQHNCDLEKDLQNSNNKLIGVLATNSLLEEQSEQLLLRVHSLQCQLYSKTAPHESEIIKKKLDKEMRMFNTKNLPITKSQAEISLLKEENLRLKSLLNSVHSEIYGARLAAKYLDKELAGRIQQIQLLGRNMRGAQHDRLWNQLEAEIHLNRHKTVIKACRVLDVNNTLRSKNVNTVASSISFDKRGVGKTRRVHLHLDENEGLGISITGGKEHGVPIIISELHSGQAAERSGNLFVGDAILSVNGKSLNNLKHSQAVKVLNKEMRQCNEILLEVILIKPDLDSDDGLDHDGLDEISQKLSLKDDVKNNKTKISQINNNKIENQNYKSSKRDHLTTAFPSPSPSSSNSIKCNKIQQSCSVSSLSCDSSSYESAAGECNNNIKFNQKECLFDELKLNDKNIKISDISNNNCENSYYNDAFI